MNLSPAQLKETLEHNNEDCQQDFDAGLDISLILKKRTHSIDQLLLQLWAEANLGHFIKASLIAVGGYGREEMHPASDIDLLILLDKKPNKKAQQAISEYVTRLWDLGLEIGHSVRTIKEAVRAAKDDQTVITNMIESRYLCGDVALFEKLQTKIQPKKLWNSAAFFEAKINEQKQRYKRFGDTAYRVEPNLKDGPGGLRDLQTIGWIFLREYGVKSLKKLSEMKEVELLSQDEYQALIKARDFLWKVRFVLHQLTGRKEDRLLFDFQRHLAHSLGFTDDDDSAPNQSIESFMQRYYRTITELERLNEIILGLLRERILQRKGKPAISINQYYRHQGGYIELAEPELFKQHPHTLLEIFFIMQTMPDLKGMTPETIRQLRKHLDLIDDDFRDNAYNHQMFINILSEKNGITFVLHRMNRYGVLAAYIPAFANIVGRMQYDLFHAYTVDEHTLKVIRNIRRLSTQKGAEELPFCSKLFKTLEKPILLYLAGLFHDIAKGRGGSHSEVGAVDALQFCQQHDLNDYDAQTVSWLVKRHLLFSTTAQSKDISDPEVIKRFASIVKTKNRLDYLYLLTICDIRGTNPTLLNSWKHSLLKGLYSATKEYLRGSDGAENLKELIQEKKAAVLEALNKKGCSIKDCEEFWSRFSPNYISQHPVDELIWHFNVLVKSNRQASKHAVIAIHDVTDAGSSALLVYTPDKAGIFVRITAAIEQSRLNIVKAHVISSEDGYDLDTFFLLNSDGNPISEEYDKNKLLENVEKYLQQDEISYSFNHHRMPRQLKHFDTPTRVSFSHESPSGKRENDSNSRTLIIITTTDTAGLLTQIGEVFNQQSLNIHDARITTLGETAEDIFYVTTNSGKIIDDPEKQALIRQALIEKLDSLQTD